MEKLNESNLNSFQNYCNYCGEYFSKQFKPKVMSCGHSICSECINLNPLLIKCLDCNTKYDTKKIKKFPINFLLLSAIEKFFENNETIKENKLYICNSCEMTFPNNYHLEIYPNHDVIEKTKENNNAELKEKNLEEEQRYVLTKYNELNTAVLSKNVDLFSVFTEELFESFRDFKLNGNFLSFLNFLGVLNEFEFKQLKKYETFLNNKEFLKKIENLKNFEELINQKTNIPNIDEFVSLFMFVEKLKRNKLDNLEEYLTKFQKKLENNEFNPQFRDLCENSLIQIFDQVGIDAYFTSGSKIRFPYLLLNNYKLLVVYNFVSYQIEKFYLEEFEELQELTNFSHYLNEKYEFFIFGSIKNSKISKSCLKISLKDKKVEFLNEMISQRCFNKNSIAHYKEKFIIFSGFANLPLNNDNLTNDTQVYDIQTNSWKSGPVLPSPIEPSTILAPSNNNIIYILDNLKKVFRFNINKNKIKSIKTRIKGEVNTSLTGSVSLKNIYDDIYFYGGSISNSLNEDIYVLNDKKFKRKGKLNLNLDGVISEIASGEFLMNNYLLVRCLNTNVNNESEISEGNGENNTNNERFVVFEGKKTDYSKFKQIN